MKTCFIRPPWEPFHLGFRGVVQQEPLQFEYLSAAIKGLTDVHFIDLLYDNEKKAYNWVEQNQPEVVGFSVSTSQTYATIRIAEKIKKISPRTIIIAGGDMPTLTPGYFKNTPIDLLCVGNGLDIMRDLIVRVSSNRSIEDIQGTIRILNGRMKRNSLADKMIPMDSHGLADRSLSQRYRHQYFMYHLKPIANTMFSKGCWNRCTFCITWMKDGRADFEIREPKVVIEDLRSIKEKWVFLVDDNVFGKGNQVKTILDGIERAGIKHNYLVEAAADDIIRNEGIIEQWARLGLRYVLIGLESPFEEDLKTVKKAANLAMNKEAIKILQKNGVDIIASIILFPRWKKEHFRAMYKFVKENNLYWVHYQCCTPLPGTILFNESFDSITSHHLDLYDMEHMLFQTEIPLKEWYWERWWLNFKTTNMLRGFDFRLKRMLPLNPFCQLYRGYLHLLWSYSQAFSHHQKAKVPGWQPQTLPEILDGGFARDLCSIRPYKTLQDERAECLESIPACN